MSIKICKLVYLLKIRVDISPATAVFPGGSKKGKSSHDIEYGHGQEKRRPSTFVEGKQINNLHASKIRT